MERLSDTCGFRTTTVQTVYVGGASPAQSYPPKPGPTYRAAIDIGRIQGHPVCGMDNFNRDYSGFTPFNSKRVALALVVSKRLAKPRA